MLFWLGLFAVGLTAGSLGALLGLGGGIFLVPALTLLFDLPVRTAVGVSLIGVIATSAGVASVSRPGRGADVGLALRLEIARSGGALLGGLAAGMRLEQALALIFSVVVHGERHVHVPQDSTQGRSRERASIEPCFRADYTGEAVAHRAQLRGGGRGVVGGGWHRRWDSSRCR